MAAPTSAALALVLCRRDDDGEDEDDEEGNEVNDHGEDDVDDEDDEDEDEGAEADDATAVRSSVEVPEGEDDEGQEDDGDDDGQDEDEDDSDNDDAVDEGGGVVVFDWDAIFASSSAPRLIGLAPPHSGYSMCSCQS
jgi:hypothetical protein